MLCRKSLIVQTSGGKNPSKLYLFFKPKQERPPTYDEVKLLWNFATFPRKKNSQSSIELDDVDNDDQAVYDEEGGSEEWSALQEEDCSGQLPSDDLLKNAGPLISSSAFPSWCPNENISFPRRWLLPKIFKQMHLSPTDKLWVRRCTKCQTRCGRKDCSHGLIIQFQKLFNATQTGIKI